MSVFTSPTHGYTEGQAPDFLDATDPFSLFETWFADAKAKEINDPNAMALASVDPDGMPNLRVVLLKGLDGAETGDQRGFVFYTNFNSAKGRELQASHRAALNFHWKSLRRQIRIRGAVSVVDDAEADTYFATRARDSRIGAWASQQSDPMEHPDALRNAVETERARFGEDAVPRPPHWSGFRIIPLQIEFWHDRPYRLHDRLLFSRTSADGDWQCAQLYP